MGETEREGADAEPDASGSGKRGRRGPYSLRPRAGDPADTDAPSPDEDYGIPADAPILREDLEWIYMALGRRNVLPSEAPNRSTGAWALYLWVKQSPGNLQRFYEHMWPKLLPKDIPSPETRRALDGSAIQDQIRKLQATKLKAKQKVDGNG